MGRGEGKYFSSSDDAIAVAARRTHPRVRLHVRVRAGSPRRRVFFFFSFGFLLLLLLSYIIIYHYRYVEQYYIKKSEAHPSEIIIFTINVINVVPTRRPPLERSQSARSISTVIIIVCGSVGIVRVLNIVWPMPGTGL